MNRPYTRPLLRAWHRRGDRRSPEMGHPPDAPTIELSSPRFE